MKALFHCFVNFIYQIVRDKMLWAVCMAPILTACFFYFGIPYAEMLLCDYFQRQEVLSGYYLLVDLVLILITPYMFCFASAMVMLTEYDENMAAYIAVTPVGKRGYILSRLVFPAVISFCAAVLLLHFFALTDWPLWLLFMSCLLTSFLNVGMALLIFSFSHNRIEGMAMAKLSGLLLLGLPVPFFLSSPVQYLFSLLPSFWIAKLSLTHHPLFLFAAILSSLIWIGISYSKFDRKLT